MVGAITGSGVWTFAGALHPLVVHFPIGLLVAAPVLEICRRRRAETRPGKAGAGCLVLGFLGAAASAASGWSAAEGVAYDAGQVGLHRWLGVAAAGLALLALITLGWARVKPGGRALLRYRFALVVSALGVGAAGHFGAELVHGRGYLGEAWNELTGQAPAEASMLPAGRTDVDFDRDVRPILTRRCVQCHGASEPEADLAVLSPESMQADRDGYAVVVPERPGESELVRRVRSRDTDERMPPKGEPLTPEEIAVLEAWIGAGAPWGRTGPGGGHWAYALPVRPNPPPVDDTNWPRGAIDHFVLARLEQEGVSPSAQADRETLIRRVSLDLTGLPPSTEEIDAFVKDTRPDAYERVVDRLLSSPAYGERMALKWMDLSRYADTHGYEKDLRREMWAYRDWVIDAFNRDEPYDRFVTAQIAGDLLPGSTPEDRIATGFLRNTQINEEGGTDPEEFRVEAVIDRANTVSTVFMGVTMGCAQCHDHKNDPISQKEYFEFFAFFNNDLPDVEIVNSHTVAAGGARERVARPEDLPALRALEAELARLRTEINAGAGDEAALHAWAAGRARTDASWTRVRPVQTHSAAGSALEADGAGEVQAGGEAPERDDYVIEFDLPPGPLTGLRLDVWPDAETGHVGRGQNGNFILTSFVFEVQDGEAWSARTFSIALADHEQRNVEHGGRAEAQKALDDDDVTGWGVRGQTTRPHRAVFQLAEPFDVGGGGARARVRLLQRRGDGLLLSRFALSTTNVPAPVSHRPLNPNLSAIVDASPATWTAKQRQEIGAYFRLVSPSVEASQAALAAVRARISDLMVAQTLVIGRNPEPRMTRVFNRGNFRDQGEEVSPGTPEALGRMTAPLEHRDRLALARWIVSPAHPLTARVTVNRLWEQCFGRGLVTTSEDFGVQGEPPTHPELLDYLATELVRQGWSQKQVLKQIVTSATYRQASVVTPAMRERDPQNLLLGRAPRVRLEGEIVRDVALHASGLLDGRIGGPSVFPPQPEGIWTMIYSADTWTTSTGPDRFRRGLYTFWRRTAPHPAMSAFDAPSRELSCARRARTSTPLQALVTMNDPQFVEAAGAMARRVLSSAASGDEERLVLAFRLGTGRSPTRVEVERLRALLDEEREAFARDPARAEALAGACAPAGVPAGADPEQAAWTIVANVILNLDETLTRG
jgi:uncharacterized membrane protein